MNDLTLAALCALLAVAALISWRKLATARAALDAARAHARDRDRLAARVDELAGAIGRGEEILERMVEGVLVLDGELVPLLANGSARKLLGIEQAGPLPSSLPSEDVHKVARRALEERAAEELVNLWPARTTLRVRAVALEEQSGVAILLQDVTQEIATSQIRKQFVANASHELKSPVASMQALAEAIRQAVRDDPPMAERFSEKLTSEADRLARIIADLLDLSRLEDPANTSNRSTDLSAVARRIAKEAGSAASAKRMVFEVCVEKAVWVRGDAQQLGLMIRNLLDNAVRYTSPEGRVEMDVFREGDDAVVRVTDTGLGIPLKAQARVFERFYRVDKDRSRERGGTGLGLSIVKHVVELHRGHVRLESELGQGSTFIVRLPGTPSPQARAVTSVAS